MTIDTSLVPLDSTWSDQQKQLIRATLAPGLTDMEFQLFTAICSRVGLDPLLKQIYAIKRGDKMTVQTGIDGYRLLAARTGDLAGIDDASYDDEREDHPTWASVTVWRFVRGQRVPFTAKARWREYAQVNRDGNPSGMWGKMPYLMLAKCAESLALRKAFPAELSGVYTAEEMEQADNTPNVTASYVEATPAPAQAHTGTSSPDRASRALADLDVLKLLNKMDRRDAGDRRIEIESVITALETAGQTVNLKAIKGELQARIDSAAELSTLDTGSIGA